MAWSWSYGPETHAAIRENILAIELHGKGGLREIFAEWRANQTRRSGGRATGHDSDFDRRRYDRALRHVDEMAARMGDAFTAEAIGEQIASWAEDYATCENGGAHAYACPFGCHVVPVWSAAEKAEELERELAGE